MRKLHRDGRARRGTLSGTGSRSATPSEALLIIRKILCPIDCSEGSKAALEYASLLAERFDAQIELVHAWYIHHHVRGDLSVWMESHGQKPIGEVVQAEAEAHVRDFVASLDDRVKSRLNVRIVQGDAASVIVEVAAQDQCDMVVMGTHGRSGLSHIALGSVAEKVVRHAKCPVLTVRMPS
jgi:universal stress protein A